MSEAFLELLSRAIVVIDEMNFEALRRNVPNDYERAVALLKQLNSDIDGILEEIRRRDENCTL